MQECGFHAKVSSYTSQQQSRVSYTISIVFPEQIQLQSSSRARNAGPGSGGTVARANSALGSFSDSLALANLRAEQFSFPVALRNPNPPSSGPDLGQNTNTTTTVGVVGPRSLVLSGKSRTARPRPGRGRLPKSKPSSANAATAKSLTVGASYSRYNTRSKQKGTGM